MKCIDCKNLKHCLALKITVITNEYCYFNPDKYENKINLEVVKDNFLKSSYK
jgi:hypothetical protein